MLWLALLVLLYTYFEARFVRIRRDRILLNGLPSAFNGLRIVHLSDLHCTFFGPMEKRLCRILRQIEGDLAIFTGDYKRRKSTREDGVIEALSRIAQCVKSPLGRIAILGNKDNPGLAQGIETADIEILSGKAKPLTVDGDILWIAGIDAMSLPKETRALISVTSSIPERTFKILLSHGPDIARLAEALGYSLILCGDTHGGQLRLPLLGAPVVKSAITRRYCRGIINEGRSVLCVSAGVGTSAFPFRLLCPPEVRVLTLVQDVEEAPRDPC
jgi:predicted MPP superfamily phosphohydrolase